MNILKKAWEGWKRFSLVFGLFMSRLILTVFYFSVMLPYGLVMRIFSDPLHTKTTPKDSGWKKREEKPDTAKTLGNQY